MFKNYVNIFFLATIATALVACSHADVYDSTLVENNQKTSFADNFVKKYGAISPNQTWDFTTGAKLGTTRAGGITPRASQALTSASMLRVTRPRIQLYLAI